MTARELIILVLRRWYFMLLGAALSVGAVYAATHQPGVYWTQFNVVLLGPIEDMYPNRMEDPYYALAPMAGVLVADWNRESPPKLMASGETTLFGQGRTSGVQVRMPNQGSQWRPMYSSPVIDVQVASETSEAVLVEARRVGRDLDRLLHDRQDASGISQRFRITTLISPADPNVYFVAGNRPRAALATGLAGATLTTIAVYWTERWLARRRTRRAKKQQGLEGRMGHGWYEPTATKSVGA